MLRSSHTSHCLIVDIFYLTISFETNFHCTLILLKICCLFDIFPVIVISCFFFLFPLTTSIHEVLLCPKKQADGKSS